jgi:predicted nucleotidyltransferase
VTLLSKLFRRSRFIYLFGSYAYGVPDKDSDLDIFVVLKDDVQMREIEAGYLIDLAVLNKKTISTDILISKKSKFQFRVTGPTLEREIFNKGIKIYG